MKEAIKRPAAMKAARQTWGADILRDNMLKENFWGKQRSNELFISLYIPKQVDFGIVKVDSGGYEHSCEACG